VAEGWPTENNRAEWKDVQGAAREAELLKCGQVLIANDYLLGRFTAFLAGCRYVAALIDIE
jgi:hypothetical protein